MSLTVLKNAFDERQPILKEELQSVLKINNPNTLNQTIAYLVSFGMINRYENGIYYIPSSNDKFAHLRPSLSDVVHKKYLDADQGIRTGTYLLYKYKLTSQVSSYYEVLSNKVSSSTRSKKLYGGKVIVSHPPFSVHKNNSLILELLELVKHIHFSDFSLEQSIERLRAIYQETGLKNKEVITYSHYYKGKRYARFRDIVREIVSDETT